MNADRWQQITHLYHAARERPEEERRAFLRSACGDDDALRHDVASLLSGDARADGFTVAAGDASANLVNPHPEPGDGLATPGTALGSYRIERRLGRGGMGAVFLAYDTTLRRPVAIKLLDSSADDETSRARLLREARSAAALNHPHICTIHEVGHASGATFIAMEYVDGRSLRDRLDEGALTREEVLRYGLQAADALGYAHDQGVVHRDFKAANVMITADSRLKIVDFGLARRDDGQSASGTTMSSLVPAGAAAGTPYAMAPEQVRGEPADARTDIWALGVLLYEMVTGTQPFTGATVPELFSSILRDAPKPWPDGVAVEIKPVIERCLDKDPARRYQRAHEVGEALEAIRSGLVPRWTAWQYHVRRRPGLASAALLLIVAGVSVGVNVGGVRDRLLGTSPAPIRMAVLPFENLTGDPGQEYFSDGLTEETITQLGRLHPQRLSVIGRTSSMRYKNREVSLAEIGRALGVDFVLEGSARREGTRVRVSAKLLDVRDQSQRWADSFERDLAGILALQSDVARGVANSLALSLLPAEQTRLDAVRPVNPEAYEAVLRGRSHVIKVTREDLDTALRYFELALQKDPDYGPAYAGIAAVWSGRRQLAFAPPAEATLRVRAAAAKAIELIGEGSAYAHARLALDATFTDWNWAAADPAFRQALDLAPNDAETRAFYAHYLEIMHRPSEAMAQMQRAIALDPLSELIQSLYGATLSRAGRLEESIVNAENILKTTPNSSQALSQISTALHRLQRYEEALSAEQRHMAARGDRQLADALTRGYAEAGYSGAMRSVADALAARPFGRGRAPAFYVRAGDHDRALDVLEQNVERHDPSMAYVGVQEIYQPLRSHPRFQAVLRKMNLP